MDEDTKKQVQGMIDSAIKTHRHDGVLTQLVYLYQLFGFRRRWQSILDLNVLTFTMGGTTNGTSSVTIIDTVNGATPFAFQIVVANVIALDTTAGTITIKKNSSTVATIAKGTVAGVVTYATSLANNSFVPGDILSAVSSSAGNVVVQVQVLFPIN